VNRLSGQFAPKDANRPGQGALVSASTAARPLPGGTTEQALFRVDLRRSLQLHRRLALLVALTGIALAVVYFFRLWPIYIAESLVYVQPAAPKVLDQGGAGRWPYDGSTYESYLQQQITTVTRPDVLLNALKKLEPGTWQGSGESDQAAAERLGRTVETTRNGSYQFAIGARASTPELSAQLANAVTASYIESASREQKAGDNQRLAILREERQRVQTELNADRAEQDALSKQLGVAGVGVNAPNLIDDDIGRTRAELVRARTDHDVSAARFTAMGAGQATSSAAIDAEADDLIAGDAGLTSMKTSLNQRRAALITQMANITPNHPAYKQDAEELAKINGNLDSMMKDLRAKATARIQERLRTDLERTAGVESKLNGQLRQLVGAAGGATPRLQRAADLSTDITRLQARFSNVDEQMHNLMLEVGGPGAVFLTSAAVPPLKPAKSGVIRNSILLGFASVLFGMLAAVGAHKLDPKLYIASDVEHVLGFAPMAQLPNFREVSDEVSEEHLLRLTAAIEHARNQSNMKSMIFTGTASGTGVTTVATRVRDILESMGRHSVLVDASGGPLSAPNSSGNSKGAGPTGSQRGSRSMAVLQQVAEEAKAGHQSLVLTDTAPLVFSAETEYLARFVDCTIVVIESGVTTRAQLRATVDALQRLDVAAVGFVLNSVGLKKADPVFRQSVQAVERHLGSQSRTASRQTVRSRHFENAPTRVAEQLPMMPASVPSEAAPPLSVAASHRAATAVPELPMPVTGQQPFSQPATNQGSEIPWWLTDAHHQPSVAYSEVPVAPAMAREQEVASAWPYPPTPTYEKEVPQSSAWEAPSSAHRDLTPQPAPHEVHAADSDENPYETSSRLSGLRGLLFSLGMKNNVDKENETAAHQDVTLPPVDIQRERPAHGHSFAKHSEPVSIDPLPAEWIGFKPSSKQVMAQPEFLPPREFVPAPDKEYGRDAEETARHDRRDAYDEVEILPSWRGQYRKKG